VASEIVCFGAAAMTTISATMDRGAQADRDLCKTDGTGELNSKRNKRLFFPLNCKF